MTFQDSDFENLTLKIHGLPNNTNLLETFPSLKLYDEFNAPLEGFNKNKVLRYIIYLYDIGTPLSAIENFNLRKIEAAKLADFPLDDSENENNVYMKLMSGKVNSVNLMIVRYCRIMRSEDYSQLIIYEEFFYNSLQKLKDAGDLEAKEHKIVLENISKTKAVLSELKRDFLKGDTTLSLGRLVMDSTENDSLGLTPEAIAQKHADGIGIIKQLGIDPYNTEKRNVKIRSNSRI